LIAELVKQSWQHAYFKMQSANKTAKDSVTSLLFSDLSSHLKVKPYDGVLPTFRGFALSPFDCSSSLLMEESCADGF
jgi:hypothetical protein